MAGISSRAQERHSKRIHDVFPRVHARRIRSLEEALNLIAATPENAEAAVPTAKTSRRKFLTAIGIVAGSDTLYQAMTTLGYGAETQFTGAPDLSGARPGSSVLVIGAGLAGMLAAYELSKAGYKVRVLEYQNRAGGRNWSLYGGATYTELGGGPQT